MSPLSSLMISRIENRLEAARFLLDGGTTGLVSLTLSVPNLTFDQVPQNLENMRYWARPQEGHYMLGMGQVVIKRAACENRFSDLSAYHRQLKEDWRCLDPDKTGRGPLLFTGFAFSEDQNHEVFPNASIMLPLLLLERRDEMTSLTFSWDMKPDDCAHSVFLHWKKAVRNVIEGLSVTRISQVSSRNPLTRVSSYPEDDIWLARVDQALASITEGELEKVVLTRRIAVQGERPFSLSRLISSLSNHHANCTIIAQSGARGIAVAATPEGLIRLVNGVVKSDALAGTMGNGCEDITNKDRHEHQLVVDMIRARLIPLCDDVVAADEPSILKLRALHHLWTPIQAQAKPGVNLFDLAAALHPTPAVGGTPQIAALKWLQRYQEDRLGWYTGAFGWMTPQGDGDLNVILRCALINGDQAELSAGAGIVSGSDPQAELCETELKLKTMLDELEGA